MLKNKVDFEETTALALKLSSTDPALKSAATDLLIGRPKLSLDAIKFLEGVAPRPTPTRRPGPRRSEACSATTSQQEARESALRALAAISEQDDPAAELVGTWLDYAKDGRHARDAGTFVKLAEGPDPGKGVLGYGVLLQIEAQPEGPRSLARPRPRRRSSGPGTSPRPPRDCSGPSP